LDVLAIAWQSLTPKEVSQYSNVKNIYQYLPELKKSGSIKTDEENGKLYLHSQLFRMSILMRIIDKITNEGYLKDLIKDKIEMNGKEQV